MVTITFFKHVPRAERATLSAYGSQLLRGQYGIRIEMEPLSFVDARLEQELAPEIILDYLALPSADPNELENTRFSPALSANVRFEGSLYFLGQHNWVDLKEIRFLNATGKSILVEYDLLIHLPKGPPNEYPLALKVQTEIKAGEPHLEAARFVDGLGRFVQSKEDSWKGEAIYGGNPVEIELAADAAAFDEVAKYARSVITQQLLPRPRIYQEIQDGLGFLTAKFKRFNVSPDFKPEEFVLRSFYFYKRRHHERAEVVIVLHHASDVGHWSLTFSGTDNGDLNWVPKS